MRNIVFGAVLALVIVFGVRYCEYSKDERETLQRNSNLIQKQLQNTSKLIVTEGTYAQVYTYSDWEKRFFDLYQAEKKALVVVNAKAQVSYDLRQLKTEIDEQNKVLIISKIPEPELAVFPEIEYYDVQQEYLNPFEAADFNKIKEQVTDSLKQVINTSTLMENAQNRLLSELQQMFVLTNSMGWELRYDAQVISEDTSWEDIKL